MNLQEAVVFLIEKSLKAVEAGETFLAAELPDVVNQLLLWHMVESGTYAFLAIILAILALLIDIKLYKKLKDDFDGLILYLLVGSVPRIWIWLLILNMFNLTWIKIWIAPKIFLIEYAAKLIN